MALIPQASEVVEGLRPNSFEQLMAAVLTIMVWLFAIVVYLKFQEIPEWLLGLVTLTLGAWYKRPT